MVSLTFYNRQGGKFYLKKDIIKRFPPDFKTYVEAFFGAGHVFFSIPKGIKEVINDKDTVIYNLLKDIQKITPNDIMSMNFRKSKTRFYMLRDSSPSTPIDRVYRYLYINFWSYRGNNRSFGDEPKTFNKKALIKKLPLIQDRLKGVTILNKDYSSVIKKYDSKDTLFYLDPPYYETDVSAYTHKEIDIDELKNILQNIKGKFILSYNDHPVIRKTFSPFRIETVKVYYPLGDKYTTELIIRNF